MKWRNMAYACLGFSLCEIYHLAEHEMYIPMIVLSSITAVFFEIADAKNKKISSLS
jgi:hypothetical protein